jgi:hypothetical protein
MYMGLLHLSFGLMGVTNETSDFEILKLALRCKINIPTDSALSAVSNPTITDMMLVNNFQVMSDEFNIDKYILYRVGGTC